MSFLPKEPTTFINIKLTDTGRRLLSLGRLTYDKAALSDREINYGIDRQPINGYDIQNNRVLAPADDNPTFSNYDGTDYLTLGPSQVSSAKQIVTAYTNSVGMFTGDTKSGFAYDESKTITTVDFTYSNSNSIPSGTDEITYDSGSESNGAPEEGQLIHIPWTPIQNSSSTISMPDVTTNATNNYWYRIKEVNSETIKLDRPTPNFGGVSTSQKVRGYVYPYNGIETYYGSAYTVNNQVWNMNIVRTGDVIGTPVTESGYTSYGSIEFNGFKTYIGLSSETKSVGIIHYTNKYDGNPYAEQLVEKTVKISFPTVMWHKTNADVGKASKMGITLYDTAGSNILDTSNNSTYRILRDGTSTSNTEIGRVYHKLQVIVITHPELLTALTYKSNRSYTLPKLNATLGTVPKFPLNTSDANGLCESGKTYYVTYAVESDEEYQDGVSFGYSKVIPCTDIIKVIGENDGNNNPSYLNLNFPASSFPFLRSSDDMDPNGSFSGTGWNANKIQILVNEVENSSSLDFSTIPQNGWRAISNNSGNGIYTGDTSDTTINPLKLQAHQFTISREDFQSGSTYSIGDSFFENNDTSNGGLNFGNESFLYGNIETGIMATSFKTSITIMATNITFNSSVNPTYNSNIDDDTYVTEIGVFNNNNDLVAVGKPTYPLKKSDGRYVAFRLEYDF